VTHLRRLLARLRGGFPEEPAAGGAGLHRVQLALDPGPYRELKDPCPVFDGTRWHLFMTAISDRHGFQVGHFTSPALGGPWRLLPPVALGEIPGSCVAAPGAIAEADRLHLFVQTDFNRFGGRIEHLVSADGGVSFDRGRTSLISIPRGAEAGIYDPHPAVVRGRKYLVYSAFSVIGQPDLYLARSRSGEWRGPWDRLGPLLRHEDVWCQTPRGAPGYEWGLEGGQLLELPDGRLLVNAVCFLPGAAPGTRQRVFFAVGVDLLGPYEVIGPVLPTDRGVAKGENGHGCVLIEGDRLNLMFQERSRTDPRWRLGLASGRLPVGATG
jgi:hypothetical protein